MAWSWVVIRCWCSRVKSTAKPENRDDAIARWQAMRGEVGELYTGHTLISPKGITLTRCAMTRVYFADPGRCPLLKPMLTRAKPLNCAGAFAIDGRGGLLVEKLEGCHTNVIGLSLPLLRRMLEELGYRVTDFW